MGQKTEAGNDLEGPALHQVRLNGVNGAIAGADEQVGHAVAGELIEKARQLFKPFKHAN